MQKFLKYWKQNGETILLCTVSILFLVNIIERFVINFSTEGVYTLLGVNFFFWLLVTVLCIKDGDSGMFIWGIVCFLLMRGIIDKSYTNDALILNCILSIVALIAMLIVAIIIDYGKRHPKEDLLIG